MHLVDNFQANATRGPENGDGFGSQRQRAARSCRAARRSAHGRILVMSLGGRRRQEIHGETHADGRGRVRGEQGPESDTTNRAVSRGKAGSVEKATAPSSRTASATTARIPQYFLLHVLGTRWSVTNWHPIGQS